MTELRRDAAAIDIESIDAAVVCFDLAGTITGWSRGAERLFGYIADEAVSRHIDFIIPAARRAEHARQIAGAAAGAGAERFESNRTTRGGRVIDVAVTVEVVRNAAGDVVSVCETLQASAEPVQIVEVRARLAAIVDSSDDAIVSKTLDGVITSWNRAAERMFGWSSDEAVGRSIVIIVPSGQRSEEELVLGKIRNGETVDHFETVRVRKDGTLIDISLTVSPIRDSRGRVIGASKIARDITDRKRLESERARLYEDARRANRAKDEFLAMLGHELRNPLGAIAAAVRVLDDAALQDVNANRACAVISRQTKHLGRLVDDLLHVGRLLSGKVVLEPRELDLGEEVTAIHTRLEATGAFSRHDVHVDARSVWVLGDPVRIEQILDNLIGNALKFTPAGGSIWIRVTQEGPEAVLTVDDRGSGMDPDLLPRIFELFVQGERKLDRLEGGLGIGLTLVKRLAELHGGSITAHSAGPGHGSRFVVRFKAIPAPRVESMPNTQPPRELHRRRILIIEDNVDAREMLRDLLSRVGHEVHEAGDGQTGIELALRLQPDVALVDIGLPVVDGYEVAHRIRAEDPGIQLIALTGYGSASDRRRAVDAGFDLHLTKPVDPHALMELLGEKRSA